MTDPQRQGRERLRESRVVFVFGCPRSGTTWVQLLLDCHSAVVTAPETHIFSFYLSRFRRQWEHELSRSGSREQGSAGLSRLLGQAQFDALCRRTAEDVLSRIAERDRNANFIVEKSPQHALLAPWIAELFPAANFVHVIRDPRDTVSSLLAASRGWGRNWAPGNVVQAARYWTEHVDSGRELIDVGCSYREVRFESLKSDASAELQKLLSWLGLPADHEFCDQAVEKCRIERVREKTSEELPLPGSRNPRGFFRKGTSGGWRDDLSAAQVRIIEHVCSDLMEILGYERAYSGPGVARGRILAHDVVGRIRESLDWQLQRLLRRI